MSSCLIYTRLISDGHSRYQNCWNIVHSNLMWPLVYIQEMTNSMTCAVHIVYAMFPHSNSCESVKLCTACSTRKLCHREVYHTLKYECVISSLFLTYLSQYYCSCYISSSVKVLASAVEQQHRSEERRVGKECRSR